MPTTTFVKNYHSAMLGAPVLSGTPGSGIAVLDVLVNGFGLQSVPSITVAGGIATMPLPNGHSFEPDVVAIVSGVALAALNGEWRILSTTVNSATFAAPGIADQTATGTITAKVAGAGWEKVFSGTNVAVYRSLNPESTRMFLRVDDTSATNIRVIGYENMTDAITGTGPFPTTTQISGGGWWPKANAANATARAWTLIADGKGFKIHIHTLAAAVGSVNHGVSGCIWSFGDFTSLKSGDAYACGLQCAASDIAASTSASAQAMEYCSTGTPQTGVFLPRSFTTLGGAVAALHAPVEYFAGGVSGTVNQVTAPAYPNGPDNSQILSKKLIIESGVCRRGMERGLHVIPQNCHAAFNWREKIDGQGELAGRKLMVIKCGSPAGAASQGMVLVDITGPWE